ncbi:MAG: hypothetical protein QOI66_3258 [Myxococcales bacterium]|nr:hypothetical protein [Myxococcales bacterium]
MAPGTDSLIFSFPDRPSVVPSIVSLSLGKEGMGEVFCSLDAVDLNGPLMSREWVVGTIPANYRAQGCRGRRLSPGEYEVALFTQRGEERRRLHVDAHRQVDVLPWEQP